MHNTAADSDTSAPIGSTKRPLETAGPPHKTNVDSADNQKIDSAADKPEPAVSTELTSLHLEQEKAKLTAAIAALKTQVHKHEREKTFARVS